MRSGWPRRASGPTRPDPAPTAGSARSSNVVATDPQSHAVSRTSGALEVPVEVELPLGAIRARLHPHLDRERLGALAEVDVLELRPVVLHRVGDVVAVCVVADAESGR